MAVAFESYPMVSWADKFSGRQGDYRVGLGNLKVGLPLGRCDFVRGGGRGDERSCNHFPGSDEETDLVRVERRCIVAGGRQRQSAAGLYFSVRIFGCGRVVSRVPRFLRPERQAVLGRVSRGRLG